MFIETNAVTGNAVVAFARHANGRLSHTGTFPTGGAGTGGTVDPLASQYAIVLDESNRFLVAVNAGSDQISSFAVRDGALELVRTVPSGGSHPVSVALSHGVLYVLDAGSNTLAGFRLGADDALTAVPAWTRALSAGATGAAAVRFSRNGHLLAVAERTSRTIDTYIVNPDGSLGQAVSNHSNGPVPFGSDFTNAGALVVSEADAGSVSSYEPAKDGSVELVTASAATGQVAKCWVIVSRNGRFAYTANAGSGSISGFSVAASVLTGVEKRPAGPDSWVRPVGRRCGYGGGGDHGGAEHPCVHSSKLPIYNGLPRQHRRRPFQKTVNLMTDVHKSVDNVHKL